MKKLKPLLTLHPWSGFGPYDKRRDHPLSICPSPACRRAKACIRATEDSFCQRTHFTPVEIRAQARSQSGGQSGKTVSMPRLGAKPSAKQLAAYRIMTDHLLEDIEVHNAQMLARWKKGELDHLYGKYSPKGIVLQPPPRAYVESKSPPT
jgi:hypothetical protein